MSSAAGAINVTEPPRRPTMEAMESSMLTIAEAVQKTGKSASTIRRSIQEVVKKDTHPDRASIEPSPKTVESFRKKGENFTWRIREDLVMREFPGAPVDEKKPSQESTDTLKKDILQILQKELELKNNQIEKQLEVIQSLNERLREGNILMGSLQQRLALPKRNHSPPPPPPSLSELRRTGSMEASTILQKASPPSPAHLRKGAGLRRASKKMVKQIKQRRNASLQKKKGIFSWLFG